MAPSLTSHFLAEAEIISPPSYSSDRNLKPSITTASESLNSNQQKSIEKQYHWEIVWRNVFAFIYLHSGALFGLYLLITKAKYMTILWTYLIMFFAGEGVTAGAHRLWSHRTYSAKWPLRLLLMIANCMAFQNHIYEWSRDHRVHHKFTDTDADPHNSRRGFFFSHMGWLMVKKHPDVKNKGKTIDMSDLEKDWVIMFQKKYYFVLMPLFCFLVPSIIPWYFWNEKWSTSWYVCSMLRYCCSLHGTWLVNSAAHFWGMKPYDRNISSVENTTVAIVAFGEGWHNYHHTFPWDYKAAELGNYKLNFTTAVIDMFAKIGWAYDLKTASVELVKKRVARTGDENKHHQLRHDQNHHHHHHHHHHHEGQVWGWHDRDMNDDDKIIIERNMKQRDN